MSNQNQWKKAIEYIFLHVCVFIISCVFMCELSNCINQTTSTTTTKTICLDRSISVNNALCTMSVPHPKLLTTTLESSKCGLLIILIVLHPVDSDGSWSRGHCCKRLLWIFIVRRDDGIGRRLQQQQEADIGANRLALDSERPLCRLSNFRGANLNEYIEMLTTIIIILILIDLLAVRFAVICAFSLVWFDVVVVVVVVVVRQ